MGSGAPRPARLPPGHAAGTLGPSQTWAVSCSRGDVRPGPHQERAGLALGLEAAFFLNGERVPPRKSLTMHWGPAGRFCDPVSDDESPEWGVVPEASSASHRFCAVYIRT